MLSKFSLYIVAFLLGVIAGGAGYQQFLVKECPPTVAISGKVKVKNSEGATVTQSIQTVPDTLTRKERRQLRRQQRKH